ncbi:MAG: DNA replication and repair protein RecF, partial [Gammaproteobacteria bacterium]|nr:DNA replication and repair protein RecF [Gammaproteobacteria bacterium]
MTNGLTVLKVEGFRHLVATSLSFSPHLNVIHGANAAGKSSLLEAIYFLARAKSFLTPRLQRVIATGGSEVLVTGRVENTSGVHRLGVSFNHGKTRVRLNGEDVRSLSEFAGLVPIQVLNTEAQRLLTEGPAERRSFLNWGVFHVEPTYRNQWRRYQRGLRQRNAALRTGNESVAKTWEAELAVAGEAVSEVRVQFLETLMREWTALLKDWLPDLDFSWRYRSGWLQGESLILSFS